MASILITGINIMAGFLIGVLQHGMDLKRAIQTYTVLTIGDGLVTVIPALMISVSGGLIVTRASSETRLGADFKAQVFGKWQPLLLTRGRSAGPGGVSGSAEDSVPGAWRRDSATHRVEDAKVLRRLPSQVQRQPTPAAPQGERRRAAQSGCSGDRSRSRPGEIGGRRRRFAAAARIGAIRRQLATDLGYMLPAVRLKDNLALKSHEYAHLREGRRNRAL